jgi:hypothetical protein
MRTREEVLYAIEGFKKARRVPLLPGTAKKCIDASIETLQWVLEDEEKVLAKGKLLSKK